MTTRDDIEKTIEQNIRTGGPVWSLLEQIDEPVERKKKRSPFWWVLVGLLTLGAVAFLVSCKAIQRAHYSQPKSR